MEHGANYQTALIITMLLCGLFLILTIYYYARLRQVRNDFIRYKMYHQRFIVGYIEVARRNRHICAWYGKLKKLIADKLFVPNRMDLSEILKLYNEYDVPSNIKEGESSKESVEEFLKRDKDEKQYYNDLINSG